MEERVRKEKEEAENKKPLLTGKDFLNIIIAIAILYCVIMVITYIRNKLRVKDEDD